MRKRTCISCGSKALLMILDGTPRHLFHSCPTDDTGDIILDPSSGAAATIITCRYSLTTSTPDPGALTAVVIISDEIIGSAVQQAAAAQLGPRPRSCPAAAQRFSFLRDSGVTRRNNGDCASLFGSFSEPPPPPAKGSKAAAAGAAAGGGGEGGALLVPNRASGSVLPAVGPGLQICQPNGVVTFKAYLGGWDKLQCNQYQVREGFGVLFAYRCE